MTESSQTGRDVLLPSLIELRFDDERKKSCLSQTANCVIIAIPQLRIGAAALQEKPSPSPSRTSPCRRSLVSIA